MVRFDFYTYYFNHCQNSTFLLRINPKLAGTSCRNQITFKNSYFIEKVWQEAATQMFYSLGPGFGSLITLSSYNRFNNNILRDTLIIVVGDTLHSVLAGCMVFTFLGGIAKSKNVSVLEVVQNGPALTFVVLMEALSEIGPVPQLLSFMFTLMLLVLGLDSV